MGKFERKFGKYAIKNLSLILIICYAFGYLFSMVEKLNPILNYLTLNPYAIVHGQIWRLFTWIIVPPSAFSLTTLITLFFYYSIGHSLERVWGDWLYNVYIFSGMLFTVAGTFILWGLMYIWPYARTIYGTTYPVEAIPKVLEFVTAYFVSTYYVNMSIFLAFAMTFPDAQVLLMFIIPIKVKWLGFLYAGLLIYEFLASEIYVKVIILMSLLNFIVFYLVQRYTKYGSPKMRIQSIKRRRAYNQSIKSETVKHQGSNGISKHKCAICGRTEIEYPDLEFRFCSKCNGNYEYCSDHLFTHKHIE